MLWPIFLKFGVTFVSLYGRFRAWWGTKEGERRGEQIQQDADLRAQNAILKKQLDVAANPPSDAEELKRLREGRV